MDSSIDLGKEVEMGKIKNPALFVLGILLIILGLLSLLGIILIESNQINIGGIIVNLIPFTFSFLITGILSFISSFFLRGN